MVCEGSALRELWLEIASPKEEEEKVADAEMEQGLKALSRPQLVTLSTRYDPIAALA